MRQIARWISNVLKNIADEKVVEKTRAEVVAFSKQFPYHVPVKA